MLRASMGQQFSRRPEKKHKRSKVTEENQLRTLRCLSQFSLQNSRIPTLGVVETYFHLMWISPYIVNFGVVTCLVTSSTWMEVKRFKFNFHNYYGSQKGQTYLPQLLQKLRTQWEVIAMNKNFAHTLKWQNVVRIMSS